MRLHITHKRLPDALMKWRLTFVHPRHRRRRPIWPHDKSARQTPRISPKVRAAIEARVCKGLSIAAAAEQAGLSRTGFAKALQRPAVADLLSETQARFVAEVNSKRALHRARALDVAMDMLNSEKTDDRVKVKLIEILSQNGKAPAVSVHVDASTTHHGGYEFVPLNARIVEIKTGDAEPDTGVPHVT